MAVVASDMPISTGASENIGTSACSSSVCKSGLDHIKYDSYAALMSGIVLCGSCWPVEPIGVTRPSENASRC